MAREHDLVLQLQGHLAHLVALCKGFDEITVGLGIHGLSDQQIADCQRLKWRANACDMLLGDHFGLPEHQRSVESAGPLFPDQTFQGEM